MVVVASLFKIPIHSDRKYEIEVKHRPAIPENIKYWQVNIFLTMSQVFENCAIDEEDVIDHDKDDPFINSIVDHEIIQLKIIVFLRVLSLWKSYLTIMTW